MSKYINQNSSFFSADNKRAIERALASMTDSVRQIEELPVLNDERYANCFADFQHKYAELVGQIAGDIQPDIISPIDVYGAFLPEKEAEEYAMHVYKSASMEDDPDFDLKKEGMEGLLYYIGYIVPGIRLIPEEYAYLKVEYLENYKRIPYPKGFLLYSPTRQDPFYRAYKDIDDMADAIRKQDCQHDIPKGFSVKKNLVHMVGVFRKR